MTSQAPDYLQELRDWSQRLKKKAADADGDGHPESADRFLLQAERIDKAFERIEELEAYLEMADDELSSLRERIARGIEALLRVKSMVHIDDVLRVVKEGE